MKNIAIIGAGPTGIYTLHALLKATEPMAISIFEKEAEAGVGMPYSDEENSRLMLANIASIEIPPLGETYLDWLRRQDAARLARYGVDRDGLHDRQFLPRILLGEYFRDRFLALVAEARARGLTVTVRESCEVSDIEASPDGVRLHTDGRLEPGLFDLAVIATGHVWPDDSEATRSYFPSPWSGLVDARIPACRVGIMGTSLSAIDAAMAVVVQHGRFVEEEDEGLSFTRDAASEGLSISLMSRSGILPEADFYCPIPYEPLDIATETAITAEIARGPEGLLDRIFTLVQRQVAVSDPAWAERIDLATQDADSFAKAYFADRKRFDPFRWAVYNLREVERNRRDRHTVPWRYAILRMHEEVQEIVSHLNDADRERFDGGLCKVFVDNYAAVPPESIRRLLALHRAGLIEVLELGQDYDMEVRDDHTVITTDEGTRIFDVFIDARGQKALETADLPFPTLRRQMIEDGDEIPEVADDYTLTSPEAARGRIAFGALPWLMHDQPFVQGITAACEIGTAIARAATGPAARRRKRLVHPGW